MFWEIVCAASFLMLIVSGIYLFTHQSEMIFYPTLRDERVPPVEFVNGKTGLAFEEVEIETFDKEKVYMYVLLQKENPQNARTIIMFQSNTGSYIDRIDLIKDYTEKCKVNFAICVYRGFDKSTSVPKEELMDQDVTYYYDALLKKFEGRINPNKIILMGRSIGVAMMLKMANRRPSEGIIIENGFTTLYDIAQIFIPATKFIPFMIQDKWDNLNEMENLRSDIKILFFSSGQDSIVPISMMDHLRDIAKRRGLDYVRRTFIKGEHMNLPLLDGYYEAANDYFNCLDNKTNVHDLQAKYDEIEVKEKEQYEQEQKAQQVENDVKEDDVKQKVD